ncbi:hypothetical protein ECPA5_0248, partial [Escherichia coli PA5]|jgi:hypothetical protein
MVI